MGLAEAHHQPRLGRDRGAPQLLGEREHAAGAREGGAAPREWVEAGDDLDVVVEHVGSLGEHPGERHLLALEVGGEHLDQAARRLAAHLPDDPDERRGALVRQVVAIHRGDDGVAQPHARDRARHAGGLQRIVPRGATGLDIAEPAAPRAGVAEDHERRGAPLPALPDVGAGGLLAHGVQLLVADQLRERAVALPSGRRHLQPRRLALAQRAYLRAEYL